MGFAKLRFENFSVTTSQAMSDVVKIVTGVAAAPADLTYASTTNSIIVNTRAENWTLVYGSTAGGTATDYVLSSPTLLAGKTHFVRMRSRASSTSSAYPSSAAMNAASGASSASFTVATIGSATSATSVTNETHYRTTYPTSGVYANDLNPDIFVSWSARHIMLYGYNSSGPVVVGSFQYPYSQLNQYGGYAPVMQWTYTPNETTWVADGTGPTTSSLNVMQAPIYFRPTTSLSVPITLGSIKTTYGYGTMDGSIVPSTSYSSTGTTAYPLVPIMYSSPSTGNPVVNISSLTNVYFFPPAGGTYGDTITVGSDTYVYLPLGTSLTDAAPTRAVAVLRS